MGLSGSRGRILPLFFRREFCIEHHRCMGRGRSRLKSSFLVFICLLVFSLPGTVAIAQQSAYPSDLPALPLGTASSGKLTSLGLSSANSAGAAGARDEVQEGRFHLGAALREAFFFTGVMHAFRFSTEPGTRDALNGKWFHDYTDSVGELRGWGDGDPFITNDIAHPIEGAVFGYIQRENDPKYRAVEWGDGRAYWISILRSTAFSAVMSTQWKLGPASEASLGNVQLHEYPGFSDFVVTPAVGAVLMIGEDATDRYLITALENRTSNIPVILLARCFLNPSRSWANLMAFKVPWHRESRIGIFGGNHQLRKELILEHKEGTSGRPFEFRPGVYGRPEQRQYPRAAPIELESAAYYQTFLGTGGGCAGGGATGATRINDDWQIVARMEGCAVLGMPKNESGDIESYAVGPRWTPQSSSRFSPFVQAIVGGTRVTHEVDDPERRKALRDAWDDGQGTLPHYPRRGDWSVQHQANGVELAIGGGFDVVFHRALAWRVGSIEYTHSFLGHVDQIRASNSVRVTTGVVLRIGTW